MSTSSSSITRQKEIFLAALHVPDADERERFLKQACGDDEALMARVREMLATDADPGPFMEGTAQGEEPLPAPGDTVGYFGDYVLLDEIARGSNGVVFRARQVSLDRVVALKMLRDRPEQTNDADVQRLHSEAKAAASLDHPHILPIYEVGAHEGQPYFSMKLITGGTLQFRMAEYQQDVRKAVALIAKVARAMQHAHSQGILHRDLKPGNILIDSNGEPHITDFGLARKIGFDSSLTMTGQVMGTPLYMSPEQARGGSKELTPATDIYSLGTMLYELIEGRRPFQSDDLLDLIKQVAEKPAPAPQTPHRALAAIAMKCLEKQPTARYATAGELADALEAWLREAPPPLSPKVKRASHTIWLVVPVILALAWAGWHFMPRKAAPSRPALFAVTGETTVTTAADELDPPGVTGSGVSLREAVRDAAPGTRITFAASAFAKDAKLVLDAAKGEIEITKNLMLDASALPKGFTLHSPAGGYRKLSIGSSASVEIVNVTFSAEELSTPGSHVGDGGAIENNGTLALRHCRFLRNGGGGNGGAIHSSGDLTIERCVFEGNVSNSVGGAVNVTGTRSQATISDSVFTGNQCHGAGGGAICLARAATEGRIVLTRCTITGNACTAARLRERKNDGERGAGGGIRVQAGTVEISQCLIAGNTSPIAGAENLSGQVEQTGTNFIGPDAKAAPPGVGAKTKP